VHGAAVQRNRLKRRLREIVRIEILPGLAAHGVCVDILVRARAEAYEASFTTLRDELLSLREWLCSQRS
jgi:ribonuclease P protein component